jgi:hypothetical protein
VLCSLSSSTTSSGILHQGPDIDEERGATNRYQAYTLRRHACHTPNGESILVSSTGRMPGKSGDMQLLDNARGGMRVDFQSRCLVSTRIYTVYSASRSVQVLFVPLSNNFSFLFLSHHTLFQLKNLQIT